MLKFVLKAALVLIYAWLAVWLFEVNEPLAWTLVAVAAIAVALFFTVRGRSDERV